LSLSKHKSILFVEIGLIVALAVVPGAFEYKTYEKNVSMITADIQQIIDEEQIPITMETPPLTKKPSALFLPLPGGNREDNVTVM
jgi:hypothetical protein